MEAKRLYLTTEEAMRLPDEQQVLHGLNFQFKTASQVWEIYFTDIAEFVQWTVNTQFFCEKSESFVITVSELKAMNS